MSNILSLEVSQQGHHHVLQASGEIDLASAPMLEERLTALQGEGPVVLDLSGIDFIDSTGLRVVLAAHQRAQDAEAELRIVAIDGAVTRLLDITGVKDRLAVFQSVDAALVND